MYFCETDNPVVETDKGRIRGYFQNDLYHFHGIPYAHAERFHLPEACESWEGVLDTQSFGYTCPVLSKDLGDDAFLHPHRWWIENENCLNLNVVTRNLGGAQRPVLVWIHGGAYSAGSAISSFYSSGENIARNRDVVHVGINHRLNILGFMDLSECGPEYENSAVLGVLDILAALKWVQKNIEKFGGDPDNVTLMGNSGGGGKIQTLMQMKEADGLYHKVIISSGNLQYILPDGEGSTKPLAEALLKELAVDTVKELETVPFPNLAAAYNKVSPELAGKGCYIGARPKPCRLYPGNAYVTGFRKENQSIPVLVGNTYGEFNSLIPLPGIMRQDPEKMLGMMLGDRAADAIRLFAEGYPERELYEIFKMDVIFRQGTIDYINSLIGNGQKVYNYQFVLDFPYKGKSQAWHCSDLPYLLENTNQVPVCDFAGSGEVETEMSGAVSRFLELGNPGWDPCEDQHIRTMYFGMTSELRKNADIELVRLFLKPSLEMLKKNMAGNGRG